MKLVCAWCGITVERPGYGRAEAGTSHGMCPACSQAVASQERGTPLQQHLDTIPIPVLLIDDTDVAVTMNARALDCLGKTLDETETQFSGKVFDCIHSRSPEGCGRTIHCSGCTIRRCVTTTFNTGDAQILVPATLSTRSPDRFSAAVIAVTTVKMGGFILLRIE
jgi:hypothetical protein